MEEKIFVEKDGIHKINKDYWNTNADAWFGTTALPTYGVKFVTEDDLHLFGDVSGKIMLEICCGSGHSLKYHADRNAAELWGVDISYKQIENAKAYLKKYTQLVILSYLCFTPDDNTVVLSDEHRDYLWADKKQMIDLLEKPIVDNLNQNSVWECIFT